MPAVTPPAKELPKKVCLWAVPSEGGEGLTSRLKRFLTIYGLYGACI